MKFAWRSTRLLLPYRVPGIWIQNRSLPGGKIPMIRRTVLAAAVAAAFIWCGLTADTAQAQQHAYGAIWGGGHSAQDMNRFYHYPYVYYPQNFWGNEYYRSAESNYYRYPQEMRIPIYNRGWQNYYPSPRRYHWGHHFITDIF